MFDETMKNYNEVVDLVENCVNDILEEFEIFMNNDDFDDSDLYTRLSLRLAYYNLEILAKYSH